MKKADYVRQLKQLIKKYHPDLCTDKYLESMYDEITKKLISILNAFKENNAQENGLSEKGSDTAGSGNELVKIKDQDYAYYRLGIKYYKNIHPDHFYKRNTDRSFETKTYEESVSIMNNIFLSFSISEYYFRKVTEEYPRSPWAEDARAKIRLLEKLYKSYENMEPGEKKIINSKQFLDDMGLEMM